MVVKNALFVAVRLYLHGIKICDSMANEMMTYSLVDKKFIIWRLESGRLEKSGNCSVQKYCLELWWREISTFRFLYSIKNDICDR